MVRIVPQRVDPDHFALQVLRLPHQAAHLASLGGGRFPLASANGGRRWEEEGGRVGGAGGDLGQEVVDGEVELEQRGLHHRQLLHTRLERDILIDIHK